MTEKSKFIRLTDANFHQKVISSKQPILVAIGADWCGSCHIMKRTLERLALNWENRFKIGWMDIDTNELIVKEYDIGELPILLFYKNGCIQDHIIGVVSRQKLENKLETIFG